MGLLHLLQNVLLIFRVGLMHFEFCENSDGPMFLTSLGTIRGTLMVSDGGHEFFAFRRIPFAKPPVRELRFKDPEPITEPWDNLLLDATEDSPICIQYDHITRLLTGDEDCLYLNVYSPKPSSEEFASLLPVMVWIHGGGFLAGTGASSLYGPERLMDRHGIVLVTINYRLGPFGFLSTLDEHSHGNYGMLDQVLALKWVKDNIASFGGDADQVTIFGDSAGSGSVYLHLLSPRSTGLFHSAIAQSGSVLSHWMTPLDNTKALDDTKDLAYRLRCPRKDHELMMKCLTRLPALDIVVKAAQQIHDRLHDDCMLIVFQPVVDISRGADAFLPDTPLNLLANKPFNLVPIITGVTQDEGILFIEFCTESYDEISSYDKNKLPGALKAITPFLFKNEEQFKKVSQEIISTYFQNIDETDALQKTAALNELFSDCFITYEVDVLNEILAKYDLPIYVYKFTHRGQHSISRKATKDMVAHADDLQYLFRCSYFESPILSGEDRMMADIMTTLWTNFAKRRVPSLKDSSWNHAEVNWEPFTPSSHKYLNLNLTPVMEEGHLSFNYNLWKNAQLSTLKDEL